MPDDQPPPGDGDDRIYDALAEWDRLRRLGPEPTAESLCPDAPDLWDRIRREIEGQRRLEARLGLDRDRDRMTGGDPAWPVSPPEMPGVVVEGELGRGSMGVVYRGTQAGLGRPVAVKVILAGAAASGPAEERRRFQTEAVATARVQHPNIVAVHDTGEVSGHPYLVLEYLGGGTLADRLRGEPQAPRWSAGLARTLALGVAAAHARGVLHRDLKPRNVIFADDGTPKIADFGLAKLLDEDVGHTVPGQSPGTPSYMAPEQAGARQYALGPATDVYALGAILYELLVGRPPFRGATVLDTLELVRGQDPVPPARLQPKVPRDLETICLKCLEKDPARRYRGAEALADDLGRFLEGRPVAARRVTPLGRAWRWCRRKPALAAALAALVLVAAAGVAAVARERASSQAERRRRDEENLARAIGMLSDWYDLFTKRPELERADMAPLRKEFLTRALDEFGRLADDLGDGPRARQARIRAMIQVSQAHADLGEAEQAAASIRSAIAAAEAALGEEPGSAGLRDTLLRALHWSLTVETDNRRALAAYRRAEGLREGTAPAPDRGGRQLRMLDAYNMGKRLFLDGEVDDAMGLLARARDLGESLAGDPGVGPLTLRGLGRVYSYIAEAEAGRQRFGEAEEAYRRSNDLFRRAWEREPRGLDGLMEYCLSCEQLQFFLSGRGEYDEATRQAQLVCRLLEEADGDGTRPDYEALRIRRRLAYAHYLLELQHRDNHLAHAGKDEGRAIRELEAMEAACRKTIEIADALRPLRVGDADLDYWNAVSCFNLREIIVGREGRSGEADRLIARACELMEESIEREPDEQRQGELRIFLEARGRDAPGGM